MWNLVRVSTGLLRDPEPLAPGDARRTTASLAWFRPRPDGLHGVTVGYGVHAAHDERRHGGFGEWTIERGATSVSARLEVQEVETSVLVTGEIPQHDSDAIPPAAVTMLTASATRRLFAWRGFEGALGGSGMFYRVPEVLRPTHGAHPVSFQAFFRLRLPSGKSGRMWNMRMSQGHRAATDHAGHAGR